MMQQRSMRVFEMGLKSQETAVVYKSHLKSFRKYAKVDDYDSLLKADQKSIQRLVEDYLFHIIGKVSPNSIRGYMAPIELFFSMNDVVLNTKKLHKMFPPEEKPEGYGAYTREDIKKMLEATSSKRSKSIIHFLACSYTRRGALSGLKMKHLHDYDSGCMYVQIYADEKAEYETFVTPECVKALHDYFDERTSDGERLMQDSPVFRADYTIGSVGSRPMSVQSVTKVVENIVKKTNINRVKGKKRYNIPITHGFRKYVNSVWKGRIDVNHAYAEKLMGHSRTIPLDNVYLAPDRAKFFKEFLKVLPDLTIDDSERLRIANEEKAKEIQELRTDKKEIAELKRTVANIKEHLEQIKK